jgi:hypothetical protein
MNKNLFSKQQLILKQVNLSRLTPAGQDVMNHLFGGFVRHEMTAREQSEATNRMAKQWGMPPKKIHFDMNFNRRYSGDNTLPRGRYYSIASDKSGNDNYTLLNELMAYSNPDMPGLFEIYDLTIPRDREFIKDLFAKRYRATYERDDVFIVRLMPLYGRSHSLVAKWNKTKEDFPLPVYVEIPLSINKVTIDKLVDLRDPATAEWFAKEISGIKFDLDGKLTRCFLLKPPLRSFRKLIPTLLEQNLGAGWNFCKIAGLHLRKLGVNGLIYPSARCDVSLELENNKLQSSAGWNFVDYRGACQPGNWILFDRDNKWPTVVTFSGKQWEDTSLIEYNDVLIHYVIRGMNKGSWWVDGLAQRQGAWFQTGMIENLLKFRSKRFYNKVFPPIVRLLVGQPSGEYHLGAAHAIYSTLRGSQKYLDELDELISRLTEEENDIKEALISLVESTARTIKRTTKKAKLEYLVPLAILRTDTNKSRVAG